MALADVDDVAELNAARGLEGAASIGERMVGGYLQVGYAYFDAHRVRTLDEELSSRGIVNITGATLTARAARRSGRRSARGRRRGRGPV